MPTGDVLDATKKEERRLLTMREETVVNCAIIWRVDVIIFGTVVPDVRDVQAHAGIA